MGVNSHTCHLIAFIISVITSQAVSGQQAFTKEPESITAILGQTILLDCEIPNLLTDVQWLRDDFGMGVDRPLDGYPRYQVVGSTDLGENTLMISNIQLEDDAVFFCQVMASDDTPALLSKKATVTVYLPPVDPTIEGAPKVEVVANEPFNLTCHARNGKPAANVTWYTAGILQSEFNYYSTEAGSKAKLEDTTGLLTITPRRSDQGRQYECVAINEALTAPRKSSVTLEVLYPPEVTMTVTPNRNLKDGGKVKFSCSAIGNPNVITWKWFRESEEIEGETQAEFETTVDRDWHGVKVWCEASNKVGPVKQGYLLNVEYGPRFVSGPEHVAADTGDSIQMKCAVDGNPAPSIFWSKQGLDPDRYLSSQPAYVIYEVGEADFGVYTCRARVTGFPDVLMNVHLLKKGAPRITSSSVQEARFGETGVIECVMRSVPKPTKIEWTKEGVVVNVTVLDRYQIREEDLPDGKRSLVEITSVQDGDFGQYNCSVENGYGADMAMIQFNKKDVVPVYYILGGVLVGVLIIIVIATVLYLYHRRKSTSSESSSDTSVSSIQKEKKSGLPDIQVTYGTSQVDAWQTSDKPYNRYSAEYDELSYPPKESRLPINGIDYPDGYGNYGYSRDPRNDYGTYPGRSQRYDPGRYGSQSVYGAPTYGSDFGGYGGPSRQPRSDIYAPASDFGPTRPPASDYGPLHPPASDYGPLQPPASDYGPIRPSASDYGGRRGPPSDYGGLRDPMNDYGHPAPPSDYGRAPSSDYRAPPSDYGHSLAGDYGRVASPTPATLDSRLSTNV